MRRFIVDTPVEPGLTKIEVVELELTEDDADDLNAGLSITTLTTQDEEVALFLQRNR